ncbi:MAG: hypothetical protein H6740_24060 [Alphaproteobacteria bacterium]|nr:hypothetical protein [Alphaproteobacteria bacterium]
MLLPLLLLAACERPPADDSAPGGDDSEVADDSAADDSAADDSASEEVPMGVFPGRYLMAIFSCERSICEDPNAFNHEVWIASSDDGERWAVPEGFEPWLGSVPDLVRRGDSLYVYAGPGLVRRYRFDTDTWEEPAPFETTVEGVNWRDPSPMVGEDGLIHMFYLDSPITDGDPAECPRDAVEPCEMAFGSAIEVDGSDGTLFEPVDGARVTVTLQPGERASDPDIFRTAEGWGLLITWLEGSSLYLSDSLHGGYAAVPTLGEMSQLSEPFAGVSAGHYDPETQDYWLYVTWPEPTGGAGPPDIQVRRAVFEGFDRTLTAGDFSPTWVGGDGSGLPEGYWAASPGFAENVRGP